MNESTQTKICTKCGEQKPLSAFHRDKNGRHGRRARCADCHNADCFVKWEQKRDAGRAIKAAERAAGSDGIAKVCIDCGALRPILDFYKLGTSPDGRHSRCRDCFITKRRRRRAMTSEQKLAEVEAVRSRKSKKCAGCDIEKPRSDFHASSNSRDGMAPRCKECRATQTRARFERTREHRLAQSADWYQANKERRNAASRAYYRANAERMAEARRAWVEANPGYMAEYMRRRRATLRGVAVGEVDLDALWTGACGICGDVLDSEVKHPDPMSKSIDHIVPVSRGGAHSQENLQWAHLICNIRKGAKLPSSSGEVA